MMTKLKRETIPVRKMLAKRTSLWLFLGFGALLVITPAALEAKPEVEPQIKIYPEDAFGVSFKYPVSWSLGPFLGTYLPGPQEADQHSAVSVLLTSGYSGTDFSAAEFTYSTRVSLSEARCVASIRDLGQVDTGPVGSIVYSHTHVEDAAMSHQRTDDLYVTARNSTCYVFDLVLLTSGYGAKDGIRMMNKRERASVARQLHQILASVRLD